MIEVLRMSTVLAPAPVLAHDTRVSPTRLCRQFAADDQRQIFEAAAQWTQAGPLRRHAGTLRPTPTHPGATPRRRVDQSPHALPPRGRRTAMAVPFASQYH